MTEGETLAQFNLSDVENKCVSAKIKKLKAEGKAHDQAIAIAISMCAPSKAKASAPISASFEAEPGTTNVRIKGANYTFHDDGDGYFTCGDFPLFSEVVKGTKGAPKDVGQKELEDLVKNGQEQYHESKNPRCAPAFQRHNPSVEGFGADPIHSGFILPNRVGPYEFHEGTKQTAFGAIKIDKATLDKMANGRLVAHSPEFNWKKWRMTGLAFLPTRPPYFEFANNTVKEVLSDPSARFEAVLSDEDAARFSEGDDDMPTKEEFAKFQDEVKKGQEATDKKVDAIQKSVEALVSQSGKPSAKPAEPTDDKTGTMSMNPEDAAKFAAVINESAESKAKLAKIENEKQAGVFMEKAEKALSKKAITKDCMEVVAKFADDAVAMGEKGPEWFDKTVDALKTSLRDKPVRDQTDFFEGGTPSATDPQDPAVAKFTAEGPEVMEQVGKFAGQYRMLKANLGDRMISTEAQFIENELLRWKADRNGSLEATRR